MNNSRIKNLEKRINNLHSKLHIFISFDDFLLIRDHARVLLDKVEGTPGEAEEILEALNKIQEEFKDDLVQSDMEKEMLAEIYTKSELHFRAYKYYFARLACELLPEGLMDTRVVMNNLYRTLKRLKGILIERELSLLLLRVNEFILAIIVC